MQAASHVFGRLDAIRRKKRKKKIPSNAKRRVLSHQPPAAVAHFFAIALKRVAKSFARAVGSVVMHRVKDFAREERADAKGAHGPNAAAVKTLTSQMKGAAKRSFNERAFTKVATKVADRAVKHSEKEFARLGIKIAKELPLHGLIRGWAKDQAARIKDMQEDQIDKIAGLLSEGFGRTAEALAEDIHEQVEDVTESRAEFIARDSILTLNANITQQKQEDAGIEQFVWTTSGDERVRDEHDDLDGEIFDVDEGDPEEGFPGESFLCRCTSFPLLPELEEGESEPEEEGE